MVNTGGYLLFAGSWKATDRIHGDGLAHLHKNTDVQRTLEGIRRQVSKHANDLLYAFRWSSGVGQASWMEEYFLIAISFMFLNLVGHAASFHLDALGRHHTLLVGSTALF